MAIVARRHGPVIVSGFGPWGSIDENPTQRVVERLAARNAHGRVTLTLPVESGALEGLVDATLDRHGPSLWIGLGLALGSAAVAVERVAVNLRDFIEPDIAGAQPTGVPIVEGGPAAYLATIPVAATVAALLKAGIPARSSNTAGAFLCNQLMYGVLHAIARRGAATAFGFLHVPAHPALVARQPGRGVEHPSMGLDLLTTAVTTAIDAAVGSSRRDS